MQPVLFHIGPLPIYTYGFCVALGVMLAVFLMRRWSPREGWTSDEVLDLLLLFTLTSFAGARVFYIIQHLDYYLHHPLEMVRIWEGGVVFYGGVIGGIIFLWFYSRKKRWPGLKVADFLAPFIALAHGFGRIGCFLNGCCYGKESSLPWSVRYPFLAFSVHPVQLYEAGYNFLAFAILLGIHDRKKTDGETALAYFLIYGTGRFFLENFRGDNQAFLIGLTLPQLISVAFVAASVLFYCFRLRKRA